MPAMIHTVCIGMPATVRHNGKDVETGIFKAPVDERVYITKTGIAGDGQADLRVHGGRDKAVYVYSHDHYPAWADELGVESLEPSQFGENLMVSGVNDSDVCIGDRYQFGTVTAIVAQPRLPCYKLGIRMGDDKFPAVFLQKGRLGFYLRIDGEGETAAGDAFERVEQAAHGITVTALWQTVFRKHAGEETREKAARCLELMPHLDEGWRRRLRARAKESSASLA